MTHPKNLILLIVIAFGFSACNTKSRVLYLVAEQDSIRIPFKIPIDKLVKDFRFWQGQTIETEGILYLGFEQFIVSADHNTSGEYPNAFWLTPSQKINIDFNYLEKVNGKKIRIKGVMDTTSKGHLSQYLATIKQIYFFEVR